GEAPREGGAGFVDGEDALARGHHRPCGFGERFDAHVGVLANADWGGLYLSTWEDRAGRQRASGGVRLRGCVVAAEANPTVRRGLRRGRRCRPAAGAWCWWRHGFPCARRW